MSLKYNDITNLPEQAPITEQEFLSLYGTLLLLEEHSNIWFNPDKPTKLIKSLWDAYYDFYRYKNKSLSIINPDDAKSQKKAYDDLREYYKQILSNLQK